MDGFTQWLGQLRLDWIWNTLILVASSLLCITVHETCHGYAAYFLEIPPPSVWGGFPSIPCTISTWWAW